MHTHSPLSTQTHTHTCWPTDRRTSCSEGKEFSFLSFEKQHHYITFLHKSHTLGRPLQSQRGEVICHVCTLVAMSARRHVFSSNTSSRCGFRLCFLFFFFPPNSLLFNGSPLASTKLLLVFLGSKLTGEKYKNCHSTVSITQGQCSAV